MDSRAVPTPVPFAQRRVAVWSVLAVLACALLVHGRSARGAAGQVDPSFGASLGLRGSVSNTFAAPGGKVYVVGGFQRIVRLNADGTLDGGFTLDSRITSFNAANIAVQPDGKLLLWNGVVYNSNTTTPRTLLRLKSDGSYDSTLVDPTVSYYNGSTTTQQVIAALVVQSTGNIVISGIFNRVNGVTSGTVVNGSAVNIPGLARLTSTGALDTTFRPPNIDSNPSQIGGITQVGLRVNDGIVIAGTFQRIDNGFGGFMNSGPIAPLGVNGTFAGTYPYMSGTGGSPTLSSVNCLSMNPDGRGVAVYGSAMSPYVLVINDNYGTLLQTQISSGSVSKALLTGDGGILLSGYLTTVTNGVYSSSGLIRLKGDGSLDSSFNPLTNNSYSGIQIATGLFGTSTQIYLGGVVNVNNQPCNGLARINLDGSLDPTFRADVAPGTNAAVNYVLAQPDGKVLIDGSFSQFNGASQLQFTRLNTDGTLDTSYAPDKQMPSVTSGFCVQPDGMLLVNSPHNLNDDLIVYGLTRFKLSGETDGSFTPNITGGTVTGEAVQPDGKILIWGGFTKADGVSCNGFTRLTPAGRLDTAFNSNVSITGTRVDAAIVQGNGQIFLRGVFTQVDGVARTNYARLNDTGTLDTTFPNGISILNGSAAGTVSDVAIQADNKVVLVGNFTTVQGVSRKGIARLNTNGTPDPMLDPQADGLVYAVRVQPDGKLLVLGLFNTVYGNVNRPRFARLNPGDSTTQGSLDTTYQAVSFNPTVSPAVALLSNGQAMVAGQFNQVNGLVRNYVARLNTDGSTDHAFNPGVGTPQVLTLAVQPGTSATDPVAQRVIVGGAFTAAGGYPAYGLARLRSDGTYDTDFRPPFNPGDTVQALVRQPADNYVVAAALPAATVAPRPAATDARTRAGGRETRGPRTDTKIKNPIVRCVSLTGLFDVNFYAKAGTDGVTYSLGLQADGKIVVGGAFTTLNEAAGHTNLGRLKADGTLDTTFNPTVNNPTANATVQAVCVQNDGHIVIGGDFSQVNTAPRLGIARLLADGALDPAFNTTASATGGPVRAVRQQSDGKLVLGGSFTQVNGSSRVCLARLAVDGTLDGGFVPPVFAYAGGAAQITSIDQQTDGKLIVAGLFDHAGNATVNKVARLYADGSVDTPYNPGAGPDAIVRTVALQADGKTLLGGDFITVDTYERSAAARLFGDYVLSDYSAVDQWRIVNFGSPATTGNAADTAAPFGDGVPNLLKYALNLNPRAADTTPMTANGTKGLPLVGRDTSRQYLTLSFVRRQAGTSPGVTYQAQFASGDPAGTAFAANPQATSVVTTIDGTWERVVVTDTVSLLTQPRRFARLLVSEP